MARIRQKYNVITLKGDHLLDHYDIQTDRDNNAYYEFHLDLSETRISKDMYAIKEVTASNETALFYQMKQILKETVDNTADPDLLKTHIVHVDFSNIFKSKDAKKDNLVLQKGVSLTVEDLQKGTPVDRLPFLFDYGNCGFTVSFPGRTVTFVPFDKSGSMSRQSVISFIDSSMRDELNKRLLLDLPFSNVSMVPTKYFAYRGLYMTDAKRIEQTAQLQLNQDTVIVLDDGHFFFNKEEDDGLDVIHSGKKIELFSAEQNKKNYWECHTRFSTNEDDVNLFDGEGLISPLYAELINQQLKKTYGGKNRGKATSFQVRMPFTKGMLHQVNYHSFIQQYAGKNDQNGEPARYIVNDIYGVKRDLSKAQIILTKSMFKCWGWLEQLNLDTDDIMKVFFEKMNALGHTLYVGNTDEYYRTDGYTSFSYQYLNPLKMDQQTCQALLENNLHNGNNSIEDLLDITREDEGNIDNDEDITSHVPLWQQVLSMNHHFVTDSYVSEKLRDTYESNINRIYKANFRVRGEVRLLSRDLLSFLIHILSDTYTRKGQSHPILMKDHIDETYLGKQLEILNRQILYHDSFYMPQVNGGIELKTKKFYAFFRSPHLSRYEECLLKPTAISRNSIYSRYFGHLKGIVMVANNSIAPMALGGADFDGDTVKIFDNQSIVEAVAKGCYDEHVSLNLENPKKNYTYYTRKAPVTLIPSSSSEKVTGLSSPSYKMIRDTFDNSIGKISNASIRIGRKAYAPGAENQILQNKCAECTIITGLEIDAAKSGSHPQQNISELIHLGERESYLSNMSTLDSMLKMGNLKIEEDAGTFSIYSQDKNIKEHITVKNDDISTNLDLLIPVYAREYMTKSDNYNLMKKSYRQSSDHVRFTFQKENNSYDENILNSIQEIMAAYGRVLQFDRQCSIDSERFRKMDSIGKIRVIIEGQYGDVDGIDPQTGRRYITMVNNAYEYVLACIEAQENPLEALEKAMCDFFAERWYFTVPEERENKLTSLIGSVDMPFTKTDGLRILTNFKQGGHKILYYILSDLKSQQLIQMKTKRKQEKLKDTDDDYSKQMFTFYFDMKRRLIPKSQWSKSLIRLCREKMLALFEGKENPEELLLACMYQVKPKYIWDFISEKTILDNVCRNEEERSDAE